MEILDLYAEVLRDILPQYGSDKTEKIKAISDQIKGVEGKVLKLELKYVEGEIEKDTFSRVKAAYQKDLTDLKIKKTEIQSAKGNYDEYLDFGIMLLSKLDVFYGNASVEGKRSIICSIFGQKIVFDGENYRTFFLNEVVACQQF